MDPTERRPWPDLPPEILSMIGKRLDTGTDGLRFRGVCSSFRSSIPPPRRQTALLRLRIPGLQRPAVFVRASTVCALETPEGGAASGCARWLLKLEESEPRRMRILSLFSQRRIVYLPPEFPRVLDSLQFRVVEICRQYTLDDDGRGTGGLFPDVQKVVMHPDSVWSDLGQCLVCFIDEEGQLGYWKYGDENWSYLDDPWGWVYDDIVVYEGKVCVVDVRGSVWQIDSSLGLQSFSLPIYGANRRGRSGRYWKHLVVSSGDLYVVDRYIRRGANVRDPMYTAKMIVYRLDRRFGGRWEEVRSLGNAAFFLSKHCSFAVPARELGGLDGNCIYYSEEAYSIFSREDVKVFSLADGSTRLLGFSDALLDMTAGH